jgi:hypothetical protein
MKKIVVFTLALIFATSFSFAQIGARSYKQMTGKVKTLKVDDPSKGTRSQLVVVDDKSVDLILVVNSKALFYDAQYNDITLDKIKVNDKVNIQYYVTKEGVNNAYSFNILK